MDIQETATIRDRGQLTIPDKIRDHLEWTRSDSVITINISGSDEILIKPYKSKKEKDWVKLFAKLKKIRSFKGKRVNLSGFIARDRYRH